MTDGGFSTGERIEPQTAQDISTFLHDHADASGFEITYENGSGIDKRLLFEVSVIAPTVEIAEKTPTVECRPIGPDPDRFTVPIEAIESLAVVAPPQSVYTATADTPTETAVVLRRLADANPNAVEVATLLPLLDSENAETRREAVRALRLVSYTRPSDCTSALPALRSIVEETGRGDVRNALGVLAAVAVDDSATVAPMIDSIVPYVTASDHLVREYAVECVAAVADDDPTDVLGAVPTLASIIEDDLHSQERAIECLHSISEEAPESVESVVDTLGTAITDESLTKDARLRATVTLGNVVNESPSVGVALVDDIATLLETDDVRLRNNAVAFLSEITPIHTHVVTQYTDTLASLLTVDDTYTRVNASAVIASVAADFPDEVGSVTGTFVQLLDDDHPQVRENACWALGYLEGEQGLERLEHVKRTDPNDDVRVAATSALEEIETRSD